MLAYYVQGWLNSQVSSKTQGDGFKVVENGADLGWRVICWRSKNMYMYLARGWSVFNYKAIDVCASAVQLSVRTLTTPILRDAISHGGISKLGTSDHHVNNHC